MARPSKKSSVTQLSFGQLSLDMTSSSNTPGQQNEEGNPDSFADISAASDVLASQALSKASEALDDLRELSMQVDEKGLGSEKSDKKFDDSFDGPMEIPSLEVPSVEIPPVQAAPELLLSQMLQQKNPEIKPEVKLAHSGKPKVGDQLRAARIEGQFELEDIAAEIKIKPQHLLAIEESRFGDLPSRTYAVGFVRAYANTLNLDVEALVAECRREVAHSMPNKQPQMMMPEAVSEQPLPSSSLVFVTAALAFLLSAVGYVFTRDTPVTSPVAPPVLSQSATAPSAPAQIPKAQATQALPQIQQQVQPQQVLQQPMQQPVVQAVPHEEPVTSDTAVVDTTHVSSGFLQKGLVAPGVPAAGVAGKTPVPSRIKLKATDETTVQIFDASGRMIAERVINRGEAFYVPDKSGLTLATTNAGAVHMQIDGKEMQALGDPDEAMHNIPLNADSLLKYLK